MKKKKFKFHWKSSFVLILAMLIGCGLGIIFKERITIIKPLGEIFINLMFMIVVPLVFFLISSSIAKFGNSKKFGKIVRTTLIVFLATSLISSVLMMGLLSFKNPVGDTIIPMETTEIEKVDIGEKIVETFTVSDFKDLLSKSHLLPLIIFSALFGFGVSKSKEKGETVRKFLEGGVEALLKVIDIIMYIAPIGICAYFANLVAEIGPELIGSYAISILLYLIGCILYFVVFYSLYVFFAKGKKGLKEFWKSISASAFTSFSLCSSIGTLPVNIETSKKLNIKEEVSSVTLSIGAATHMEGSSMGTVLKIMFLFAIFGRDFFTIPNILITLLFATFICTAMSGVPSGGLISEMLIISIFGFPLTAYPLLATIAWLIDAPATMLNATGDIPSTMLVEKLLKE